MPLNSSTIWREGVIGFVISSDGIFPGSVHLSKITAFGIKEKVR